MTNKTSTHKIRKDLQGILVKVANVAGKAVVYPVLGNLSENIQDRIKKATGGWYSPQTATEVSSCVNIFAYSAVAFMLIKDKQELVNDMAAIGPIGIGFLYSPLYAESIFRMIMTCGNQKGCASVLGKIASLPLEAIVGVYDAVKSKTPVPAQ